MMGLTSPFVFYALVDIVIRFFYTDLSVLILLSLDQTLTEVITMTTAFVRTNNTLKTSKMNDIIILAKRDKPTPYGDHKLQQINAS